MEVFFMLQKTRLMALTSLGVMLGCFSLYSDQVNSPSDRNSTQSERSNDTDKTSQIDMKRLSEAFGHFIGRNLQTPGLKFDIDGIIKGIRDGAAGHPAPLSDKEYEEMMAAVQERAFKEMSSSNLKAANEFMSKNASASGVVEVVPNKLQFLIIKQGTGPAVETHSSPKINYTGKYQDGTVFGSSEEVGGPITIPLDQTIPGFSKGIVGMKEGEKRRLFVHPDLGYGTSGQLPPNELLIFDIELVKAQSDEAKSKVNTKDSLEDEDDDLYDDEDMDDDSESENAKYPGKDKDAGKAASSPAAAPAVPVRR